MLQQPVATKLPGRRDVKCDTQIRTSLVPRRSSGYVYEAERCLVKLAMHMRVIINIHQNCVHDA